MKVRNLFSSKAILSGWLLLLSIAFVSSAQPPPTKPPVVKQINEVALKQLIKPKDKPLLVNFWATWCDPCRDEFPDLVKLDNEYRGKIDFITISLDFPEDIHTAVPKFLAAMKAEMPTYVLITPDETAAIGSVNKDWQGGLPFTILYDKDGKMSWVTQKVVKLEAIRPEIDKLIAPQKETTSDLHVTIDYVKIRDGKRAETMFYYENNWKPYRDEALKRGVIHSYELLESIPETTAPFDLILVTRYTSADQHKNSEKNFEPILKELSPSGPRTLNSIKPDAFRQSVFVYRGKALMTSIP